MSDEIMLAVTRHHYSSVSATLNGYSRKSVRGEAYPAIFSDSNDRVLGMLYLDVGHAAWEKLDAYEGEMYSRERVVIELKDGSVLPAETYVIRSSYRYLLTNSEWDYEKFLSHSKKRYLQELK